MAMLQKVRLLEGVEQMVGQMRSRIKAHRSSLAVPHVSAATDQVVAVATAADDRLVVNVLAS